MMKPSIATFLIRLSDAFRDKEDAIEIQNTATRMLGEYTGANRVGYAEARAEDDKFVVTRNYTRGVPSLEGVYSYDDFGKELYGELAAGRTEVRPDIAGDPWLTVAEKEAHAMLQMGATVNVPFRKGGELVAILFIHHTKKHNWTAEEIDLFERVAERTWEAVQRVVLETDLQKSAALYRNLFTLIDEGFYIIELIYNNKGAVADYRFVETNPAFERHTGLQNVAGKLGSDIAPHTEEVWVATFRDVLETGKSTRFEAYNTDTARWYSTFAFCTGEPDQNRVAVLFTDITERKQDEQRKNDFIGTVSHEMKTPLTSLYGYLQLLQMRASPEDDFAITMLDKATRQINKITTLINGFLNVSRLESGKIHIEKQRFDMADLVKESEEEAVSMYSSHRIVFHPVEETFVNGDKDKIGQVISNLISNAVKYSPVNTVVNVA